MLKIDIQSTVFTAVIIMGVAAILTLIFGINHLTKGRKIPFFGKRQARMRRGWRLIIISILLIPLAWVTLNYAEPMVYVFITPSPTVTQTPTVTVTPSVTITPSITLTPTITDTPSITSTPSLPPEVESKSESEVPPNPDALFSPIVFARRMDEDWQPIDPAEEFDNPVGQLFGTFSYNNMAVGSQWSALWYWEGELVHFQTRPWLDGTGGYGYTNWEPPDQHWRPGTYEVQIFVGTQWKVTGFFTVLGEIVTSTVAPSPTWTQSPTASLPPTQTDTPTRTPTSTPTVTPSQTRWPTATNTMTPTMTRRP